jgi:DNA-binding transcriptional regulator YiaG
MITPTRTRKQAAPGTIGARVLDAATRLRLSDQKAAYYFGVPLSTYLKWVRGERTPNIVVNRLIDVLDEMEQLKNKGKS